MLAWFKMPSCQLLSHAFSRSRSSGPAWNTRMLMPLNVALKLVAAMAARGGTMDTWCRSGPSLLWWYSLFAVKWRLQLQVSWVGTGWIAARSCTRCRRCECLAWLGRD